MKVPTKKQIENVLLHTDCAKFLTLVKHTKHGVTFEVNDLVDMVEVHMSDMAKEVRKFLVKYNKEKK